MAFGLAGCRVPNREVEAADREVEGILTKATAAVTGQGRLVEVERPDDTLRGRLLHEVAAASEEGRKPEPTTLTLVEALDVAAENSRDFQRQKESLYLVALALTRASWDFSLRFAGGGSAEVAGVGDDSAAVSLSEDLRASQNTVSGTRIVASFVNTFLRSLTSGVGGWDASSILGLSLTQPLLRGVDPRVVREPLTQSERDVIYQVRDFERFRSTFAVRVTSDYYGLLQLFESLKIEEANRDNLRRSRERIEAMAQAGRNTAIDVGRAQQSEFSAENRMIDARARLEAAVDRFLITLGLPTDAVVTLDPAELLRLEAIAIVPIDLEEDQAIEIAFSRRLDYRNVRDEVDDAARRTVVAADALRSSLDFSAAVNVPTEPGDPLDFDWSRISWRAGFDLELALDKLPERNAYRSSLISLDVFIRAREQVEDEIKRDVRDALRQLRRTYQNYLIQTRAVELAAERVQSTRDFFEAGDRGVTTLDVLDAQESLLQAQLAQIGSRVDYAVARLQLMVQLEGLVLEPYGLRFDPDLPMPQAATERDVHFHSGGGGALAAAVTAHRNESES